MNVLKFLLSIVLYLLFTTQIYAQDIYGTANGIIQITGSFNDSTVVCEGKNLVVNLNYETAEIELQLNSSTLNVDNARADSIVKKHESPVVFSGHLNIEYVNTDNHPPQDFEIEGVINIDPDLNLIKGKGHLEHIFGATYSCVLSLTFHLNINDLPGIQKHEQFGNEIHVEIVHTVLNRDFNNY